MGELLTNLSLDMTPDDLLNSIHESKQRTIIVATDGAAYDQSMTYGWVIGDKKG